MKTCSSALADRVTSFILIGTVTFYLVISASLDSIRVEMNRQAAEDTARFMDDRLKNLQDQVRQFARDYNNWSDVYFAAMRGNITFLSDNYGITAVNGDMFDGAIMFDGPFSKPISWVRGGDRIPDASFVSEQDLNAIRHNVSMLAPGDRSTFDFVILDDGITRLASASRILPDTSDRLAITKLEEAPIGIIVRTPDSSEFEEISANLGLRALRISEVPEDGYQSIAINGVRGVPTAFFNWLAPLRGNRLVAEVAPVMIFIFLISIVVVAFGTRTLRISALAVERREAEARSEARVDPLTSLPNRLALNEHLASVGSDPDFELAVIVIDLDHFKNINDLLGHSGGDEVIRQVAKRFKSVERQNIFFSRIGGDEFVAVVHTRGDVADSATRLANELLAQSCFPINCNGSLFEVFFSCGIAVKISPDQSFEEVLQCADRAMYHSKKLSGNRVTLHSAEMDRARRDDREVQKTLRSAVLRRDEFSIRYQPIIDARSRCLVRVEALARWDSPTLGSVSPDTFIRIAEDGGVICVLGEILLENIVCDMLRLKGVGVSINVSPLQLVSPGFTERFCGVFDQANIDLKRVEIELTERIAVSNFECVSNRLLELRARGVTTALDDFGTGFSSLAYLRDMPFDTLKIDKSFVSGVATQANISDFICPIVALGHSLGKKVTAEGVETKSVAELLSRAGCDNLQGYFFGRPQPIEAIVSEIASGHKQFEMV